MNLVEIKQAVDSGIEVFWKSPAYKVIKAESGHYYIRCILNGSTVGLTHQDGVTMDAQPYDFFYSSKPSI